VIKNQEPHLATTSIIRQQTKSANNSEIMFTSLMIVVGLLAILSSADGFNPGTAWRNAYAFAALKQDGSVAAWGHSSYGGSGVPSDLSNVQAIYSTQFAFAALKQDGSVAAWGDSSNGGSGVPSDLSNVQAIYSTHYAFAALKQDGSVAAWGDSSNGGSGMPSDLSNVQAIYSTAAAFAALKQDGSVAAWGHSRYGGSGVPSDLSNVQAIYSTHYAFAALKQDGSVAAWGYSSYGGSGVPSDLSNVQAIYSTARAFAALKQDGSVAAWGDSSYGGSGVPSDLSNVQAIYSTHYAFAALKQDGSVAAWGDSSNGGSGMPSNLSNVQAIYSTSRAFAALKQDGSVAAWGYSSYGGSGVPSDLSNVQAIYSTARAFAALKQDGSVAAWGYSRYGGSGVSSDLSNVQAIYSTETAFAALKQDGSVAAWGYSSYGGSGVPSGLQAKAIYGTHLFQGLSIYPHVFSMQDNWVPYPTSQPTSQPTSLPTSLPTSQPTSLPTSLPTSQPTSLPTSQPTSLPTSLPTSQPTSLPTSQPTSQPTSLPTSQPTSLPSSQPTSLPTSLPTSQPTSQPSSQPTSQPTSLPSSQPTSQPSCQPTGSPTSAPSKAWISSHIVETGLPFDSSYLSSGLGFRYFAESEFRQIGRQFSTYYLSIFIYDTGFGPVEAGQYLTFDVNGQSIMDNRNALAREPLKCAPVKETGDRCKMKGYAYCIYNYEIPAERLKNVFGGSLFLNATSQGVVASACPSPSGHEIYVKYELTGGKYQATPTPTMSPTQEPTKATTQVNGLQLDLNKLNVWNLLQIAFAAGVLLGGGAVYLCKLREKSKEAYQHPMPYAVINLGMLGVELTSMIFLLVELFRYGYGESGGALVGFRFMKMVIGVLIVSGVYFPPSQSFLKSFMDFSPYLDWDHMIAESKVYFVVSAMSVVDLTFVVFLPWKNSRFATLSKGFPNLVLFRLVQVSLLVTSIVSFAIQLSYLSTATFVLERDLMFIINLILLSIKLLLITLEFFYKNHVLGATPTVLDDSGDDKGSSNTHDVESADNSEIFYQENPMLHNDPIPVDEENKPLLEKSVKRMQGKLSSLELEMSTVKAETDSMETKVEGVETKVAGVETKVEGVDEETRLLKSQMERENSALKEENSAFKARLETLERKIT
jgi:alpha-tubulin suppressor-like RCC1 family protein